MKAFVTGGTGFIGSRVVRRLAARGYQVKALVRSQAAAAAMRALGAAPVWGDITATESMRAAMRGCDVVFHIAGWYQLGGRNWRKAEAINVEGTRNVLSLANELGVGRIVYTSTVTVFGDTHGLLVDETYRAPQGPFLTEYDRTKWMAHYEVALPLIEQGAPITIVMPGVVYGPGDPSLVGDMMRYFYLGLLTALPAPEMTLTFAYVDDVAEGHILAAEKGRPGESYILAGPALSIGDAARLWAQVTGRPAPLFHIPGRLFKPLAPLMARLEQSVQMPAILSHDAIAIAEATYLASSKKAQAELGWECRPLAQGLRATFDDIAQTTPPIPDRLKPILRNRRSLAALLLGGAIGLSAAWFWLRRK